MMFTRDNFRQIETPDVILCKANGERIGTLKTTTPPTYDRKFQELDELSFTVNMVLDGVQNEYYELIEVMKYVELKDVGFFFISDVSVKNEGTELESKEVTCKSYECLMDQKYLEEFYINRGETGGIDGVVFYNLSDKDHSLLHLCLEKCPDWTIGHIDSSLMSMGRSFDVSREGVYSFLNGEVSEAFGCFFIFDTIQMTINAYATRNYGVDTNIFVSYDNLLKNADMSCSSDDIKTALAITGEDELEVREINMGFNTIYNLDYYNSKEFWSDGLYEAYNAWKAKRNGYVDQYTSLLSSSEQKIVQINYLTDVMMPDDPASKDWSLYGLKPLNEQLSKDESIQTQYMKAGFGNATKTTAWSPTPVKVPEYDTKYLPLLREMDAIRSEIAVRTNQINTLNAQKESLDAQKKQIQIAIAIENNFSQEQLKELSSFIREEQLNTSNFVVTDEDSEERKYSTLHDLLKYGEEELYKVATPQLTFSAELVDLFEMPEFDVYSGEFEVGNYIWVELRDNYRIKAKLLSVHYEFGNPDGFSVTFGNVFKFAKNAYTTIQDVINKASSVATSVSFNASYWSDAAKNTSNISQMISDGLLDAGNYISNGADSELLIDKRGLFVTTKEGQYADKDSIYIGGGRILFTEDNWKTVSEAIGRVTINNESHFGVIAQVVAAGFIYGSEITGTKYNNGNGTFAVDENGNLTATSATIVGKITANEGYIGGTNGFTIKSGKLYSGSKSSISSNVAGVYIGTDGIALGANNVFKVTKEGALTATNVDISGKITATSGKIGGFDIGTSNIHNGKTTLSSNENGVYIGTDGIALGVNNKFSVTKAGVLTSTSGTIGGFTIDSSKLYNGKPSLSDASNGVYIGTNGIALGANNAFYVTNSGYLNAASGKIGGCLISNNGIHSENGKWWINSDGTATFVDCISPGSNFGKMNIGTDGYTYYNSEAVIPFQGTCVAHIEKISANYIYTNYLKAINADITNLSAKKIDADVVASVYATLDGLYATNARIDRINADYISTNNLEAEISKVNVVYVNSGIGIKDSAGGQVSTIMANMLKINNWFLYRDGVYVKCSTSATHANFS